MDVGVIPDLANSDLPGIGGGGGVQQVSQASTISQMSPLPIAQMVPIRQTSNISQAPNIKLVSTIKARVSQNVSNLYFLLVLYRF